MIRFMLHGFALCLFLLASGVRAESPLIDIITDPDAQWRFRNVVAVQTGGGWVVSGRLTDRLASGLPAGHVDLAVYDADSRLQATTTAAYSPSLLTPKVRKKGGVRFSAVLSEPLPVGARIKVAFHAEPSSSVSALPVHSGNIAR